MASYRIQGRAERRAGIHYEFDPDEEPLGEGGMGKVFRGLRVDDASGSTRQVAIKFMFDDLPPSVIERARREASIQLRHENLVEMLGFIDTEETTPLGEVTHHYHVVSELLEGVMLDDLLQGKLNDRRGNPVAMAQKLYHDYQHDTYRFATHIVRSVLSGLMTLHDAGFIHRDIDPTNIMVTTAGQVKLIDFGIAKQMRSLTTGDKSLTVAGAFMGKPEYAAPELVLGDIKNQDQTTDIYAVGILLFQCIVGHPPFEGDRADVLQMQLHSKMPLHLIRNSDMRRVIATATEKSRAKRYQSAAEFRVALDHLPLQLKDSALAWRPAYTIAAAVAAAAIAAGVAAAVLIGGGDDTAPKQTIVETPKDNGRGKQKGKSPGTGIINNNTGKDGDGSDDTTVISVSADYQALYAEADSLYRSGDRERTGRPALAKFEEALRLATEAGDAEYVSKCKKIINRIKDRL